MPVMLAIANSLVSLASSGVMEYLSAAHTFDYIVLRINPGLTTCKDLAMMVDNSLDNN